MIKLSIVKLNQDEDKTLIPKVLVYLFEGVKPLAGLEGRCSLVNLQNSCTLQDVLWFDLWSGK